MANSVPPAKAVFEFAFCFVDPIVVFIVLTRCFKRRNEAFESSIQVFFDNLCDLSIYDVPIRDCFVVTKFHCCTGKLVLNYYKCPNKSANRGKLFIRKVVCDTEIHFIAMLAALSGNSSAKHR